MALDTERSEQHQLSNGFAGLKGFANDIWAAANAGTRRLAHASAATANGTTKSMGSAARSVADAAHSAASCTASVARRTAGAVALGAQSAAAHVEPVGAQAPKALAPLQAWFSRLGIVRFFSASLLRRILISNLMGFVILVGGILYLGWFHTWLIDAKLDALKTQGRIIADAIAANAKVVRERIVIDPDAIPEAPGAPTSFPDDGLTSLELSIHPEEVTPILRKLIQPTNTRARIYARDGTLIVDTAQTLARWTAMRNEPTTANEGESPETQNIWTRLTRYFFKEPLPVYQEIGVGNGMAYKEVRAALAGEDKSMLLLNRKGEQIVSIAQPIRRFNDVQGVLLLSTRPGQIDKILKEERIVILVLAAIALLASVVTSLLLARTVAGPMRRLSAAAERVSHNIDARTQLPEYSGRTDEVAQMATAFHAMTSALCRRIEASEKFAADVAHELKNPLTAARSTAESLGYAKTEEERTHLVHANSGRAEAPQPADHRRLQRLAPRRRARPQGDAHDRCDGDAAQRRLHLPRHHRRRQPRPDAGHRQRALPRSLQRQRRRRPPRSGADQPHRQRHLVLAGGWHRDCAGAHCRVRSSRSSSRTMGPASPMIAWRSSSIASTRIGRPPMPAAARTRASASASRARSFWRTPARSLPRTATKKVLQPEAKPCGARFIVRLPIAGIAQRGGAPGGRRS